MNKRGNSKTIRLQSGLKNLGHIRYRFVHIAAQLTKLIKNNMLFVMILFFMLGYNWYRMFLVSPNSDELGFWYLFTKNGIFYSLTQWVAPGNHMLYLVLSAFLDKMGNAVIGMRGVSYLASCINLFLLYYICHIKCKMRKEISAVVLVIYSASYGIAEYATSGRGYTLVNTLLLCLIICLGNIAMKKVEQLQKKDYIKYAVAMALGCYVVPTFLYCIAGCLLAITIWIVLKREYKKVKPLIVYGIYSGIGIFILYMPVFIFLGVNEQYPDMSTRKFGFKLVAKSALKFFQGPIVTIREGIESFISSSSVYTHSIPFEDVLNGLYKKLCDIAGYVTIWSSDKTAFFIVCFILIGLLGVMLICRKQHFYAILVLTTVGLTAPIMLLQKVLPFTRVFTYLAVPISIGIGLIINIFVKRFNKSILKVLLILVVGISCFKLTSTEYLFPYKGTLDDSIYCALEMAEINTGDSIKTFLPGGCYQEEYVNFYIAKHKLGAKVKIVKAEEKPDWIILNRAQTEEGYKIDSYISSYNYDDLPWDWITDNMYVYYSDENIVAYLRDIKEE